MPLELPEHFNPALPTRWCIFDGPRLLLQNQALPGDAARHWPLANRLFIDQQQGCNLYAADLVGPPPADCEWLPLRAALMALPPEQTDGIARAAQLRQFQHTHRFCGHCASPLQQHSHDQGKHCPSCGQLYYPRLSPAMMVAVYRGQELLLARSPHFLPGVYSALAGFVEPGETLEQCVHRETQEEVGVRVKNLRYVCSQSWPFPHSLMLAFTAEYDGGEIRPQEGEIEDAGWYHIDALPTIPAQLSVAYRLIRHTADWLRLPAEQRR
ncbi:NADH pyrophosphatase [Aquitalea magnusonii]|uniref:NAD(+) diphosphatase n=1 Tax=Aquitalea pelogenes TaxID=1293573 RepID=UPI0005F7BFBF|nr:NAD(+) diphosphatase [Aquitalea pelogenes]KJV33960.1 NADH pyrophosphatase [Aquitalea magnusonii]